MGWIESSCQNNDVYDNRVGYNELSSTFLEYDRDYSLFDKDSVVIENSNFLK